MIILDVETAFLYRDLKEDIYMDLLAGFFSLDENILEVTDIYLKINSKWNKPIEKYAWDLIILYMD